MSIQAECQNNLCSWVGKISGPNVNNATSSGEEEAMSNWRSTMDNNEDLQKAECFENTIFYNFNYCILLGLEQW